MREHSVLNGSSNYNLIYSSVNDWNSDLGLFDGQNLSSWQSSSGNDLNSSIQDPLLVSTDLENENFCVPQSNSPLVDSGKLTGGVLDYNGNLRDSVHDIGAIEYFSEMQEK